MAVIAEELDDSESESESGSELSISDSDQDFSERQVIKEQAPVRKPAAKYRANESSEQLIKTKISLNVDSVLDDPSLAILVDDDLLGDSAKKPLKRGDQSYDQMLPPEQTMMPK